MAQPRLYTELASWWPLVSSPESYEEEAGVYYRTEDADGRSLRYLEWSYDPDPDDDTYIAQYVFVLREGDEPARVVPDRHELGLFGREVWLDLCRSAGLEPEIRTFVHSELAPHVLETILCRGS